MVDLFTPGTRTLDDLDGTENPSQECMMAYAGNNEMNKLEREARALRQANEAFAKETAELRAEVEALRMVARGRDCLLIERSLRENPRKEVVDMITNGLARLRELGKEEA